MRVRHRLDRRGNRLLHATLHRIAVTRARTSGSPSPRHVARRLRAGKRRRKALRALKRHLARRIFRTIRRDLASGSTSCALTQEHRAQRSGEKNLAFSALPRPVPISRRANVPDPPVLSLVILALMDARPTKDADARAAARAPMRIVKGPINRETIQAIAQLIVQRFQPQQIILFGSCVRGETDEHSDLDLLVVLRPGVQPHRRGNPIHAAIADNFILPVDRLIRSYEAFATYRPDLNSMLSRMLEDSEVLCDRRAA